MGARRSTMYFIMIGMALSLPLGACRKPVDHPPGGQGSSGTSATGEESTAAEQATAQLLPDLTVSAIEVFPAQPQAGVHFAVNVYVRNAGQASSGKYDVAMFIRDTSRELTYPVGTFRKDEMHPGENYPVYSSTDRLVNDPGSYQVHVKIQPLFKDGNEQNNTAIWSFGVK